MEIIGTILLFVLVLGVLVLVHEFGHFIVAKKSGMRVDEFGFGFPPRIFGKEYKGTLYSVNWLPLGGFVKIKGVAGDDDEIDANTDDSDSFSSKPFWKKFSVLFAGIGMNLLLAVVLFSAAFAFGVRSNLQELPSSAVITDTEVIISQVLEEGPAAQAGIQAGDKIIESNEVVITRSDEFLEQVQLEESTVNLTVEHQDGTTETVALTSQEITSNDKTYVGIGVGLAEIGTVRYPVFTAIVKGVEATVETVILIGASLLDLVTGLFTDDQVSQDFAGPIGIAVITKDVAALGISNLLQFMALLSVNLALFNFLPIPALDGGRIVFVVLEKLRGKPVNQNIEALVHNIGFLLLLGLVLLVSVQDISRFI